jgi:hypothetical protein
MKRSTLLALSLLLCAGITDAQDGIPVCRANSNLGHKFCATVS